MLKWGIIGVGRAGRARARAIQSDPRASVSLGFRGAPDAVGLQAATSIAAMLEAVDAVAICSTDETHFALVRQALQSGCWYTVSQISNRPLRGEEQQQVMSSMRRGYVKQRTAAQAEQLLAVAQY